MHIISGPHSEFRMVKQVVRSLLDYNFEMP